MNTYTLLVLLDDKSALGMQCFVLFAMLVLSCVLLAVSFDNIRATRKTRPKTKD